MMDTPQHLKYSNDGQNIVSFLKTLKEGTVIRIETKAKTLQDPFRPGKAIRGTNSWTLVHDSETEKQLELLDSEDGDSLHCESNWELGYYQLVDQYHQHAGDGAEESKEDTEALAQQFQDDADFEYRSSLAQEENTLLYPFQCGDYSFGGVQTTALLHIDSHQREVTLFSHVYVEGNAYLQPEAPVLLHDNDGVGNCTCVFFYAAIPLENDILVQDSQSHQAIVFKIADGTIKVVPFLSIVVTDENIPYDTEACRDMVLEFLLQNCPANESQSKSKKMEEDTNLMPEQQLKQAKIKNVNKTSLRQLQKRQVKQPKRFLNSPIKSKEMRVKKRKSETPKKRKSPLFVNEAGPSTEALESKKKVKKTKKVGSNTSTSSIPDMSSSAEQPLELLPKLAPKPQTAVSSFPQQIQFPGLPQQMQFGFPQQNQMMPMVPAMVNDSNGIPQSFFANVLPQFLQGPAPMAQGHQDSEAMRLLKGLLLFQFLSK